MKEKIKLMFVCHGNICRSPMAESVFKKLAEERGISDRFYVSSCAVSTEEIYGGVGNPVYPPAAEELKKHGISCSGKRAILLRSEDYAKYDLFLAADSSNVCGIMRIFGSDPAGKVYRFAEYADLGEDIEDPWYTGDFASVYRQIYACCMALIEKLCK